MYFQTDNRSPIEFVCREEANLWHDMVFLRSYPHDAEFEIDKVRLRGKVLRIPVHRDRWELYKSSEQLESIATKLIISPVLALKWESMRKVARARTSSRSIKFYIRDVYLGESY